jgi:hypothetical protein
MLFVRTVINYPSTKALTKVELTEVIDLLSYPVNLKSTNV